MTFKSMPPSVPSPLSVGTPPLISIAAYSKLNQRLVDSWPSASGEPVRYPGLYQPAMAACLVGKMWGLRISEVLQISNADFSPFGIVFVRSAKKSRNRIIYIPFSSSVLQKIIYTKKRFLMFPVPESQCIRIAKKLPELFSHAVGSRIQRTHSGRYELASWLASITTVEDVQNIMGHIDAKNTACYI